MLHWQWDSQVTACKHHLMCGQRCTTEAQNPSPVARRVLTQASPVAQPLLHQQLACPPEWPGPPVSCSSLHELQSMLLPWISATSNAQGVKLHSCMSVGMMGAFSVFTGSEGLWQGLPDGRKA